MLPNRPLPVDDRGQLTKRSAHFGRSEDRSGRVVICLLYVLVSPAGQDYLAFPTTPGQSRTVTTYDLFRITQEPACPSSPTRAWSRAREELWPHVFI